MMSVERPKESMSPSLRKFVPLRRLLSHDKLAVGVGSASNWISEGLAHVSVVSELRLCWGSIAGSQKAAHSGSVNHSHLGSPNGK